MVNNREDPSSSAHDPAPPHPGEVLKDTYLRPKGRSQASLARAIHVPVQTISEIVNGRHGVTPALALKLANEFGTPPEMWSALQWQHDLWSERRRNNSSAASPRPKQNGSIGQSGTHGDRPR